MIYLGSTTDGWEYIGYGELTNITDIWRRKIGERVYRKYSNFSKYGKYIYDEKGEVICIHIWSKCSDKVNHCVNCGKHIISEFN